MALSRMSDQIGRVLDGRYRLVTPIGTGASGRVYLADDVRLRRRVAVKVLHASLAEDESFLRRFQAEAHAAAALNHPHVMAIYDWGHDEVPYLVTEYLGGGSLRALLDRGHRLSVSQALLVGLEATRGLDYAHRRGFVHRDIKPANLLFGDDGRLRIADFGLARALAEAGWTEPSGAVVGTARYASPEQAKGENVDGKSDVYALGLTLIEAVSGSVPFAADTTIATLMARIDRSVELDESFGPLRAVLERACNPDPAARPDASALAVAFMASAETLSRPEPLPLAGAIDGDLRVVDADEATVHSAGPEPTFAVPVVDGDGVLDVPVDDALPMPEEDRPGGGARRRRWPWVLLALAIAGVVATGTAFAIERWRTPPSHEVVDYTGAFVDDVHELVAEFGWSVDVREERLTGSTVGTVLVQEPEPGTMLREGADSELVLWVSIGNALLPMPAELEQLAVADAEAAIVSAGFVVGSGTEEHSEDVDAGHVIAVSHEPLVDGQLPEGSAIGLVASLGPAPRTIPAVGSGATYDDVAAVLSDLGLVPEEVAEPSESVSEGVVIRTEPGDGEQAARGDTVRVVVSSGLPFVTVPDVEGMSEERAIDRLRDAGLRIGSRVGPPGRNVLATDPPAGESVRKYTEVNYFTRST